MSSDNFVIEEIEACHIKSEKNDEYIDLKDDRKLWKSTPKHVAFIEDWAKCGEVMVAREGVFKFVCSICKQHFGDLGEFKTHIENLHIKSGAEDGSPENCFSSQDLSIKKESLEKNEGDVSNDAYRASNDSQDDLPPDRNSDDVGKSDKDSQELDPPAIIVNNNRETALKSAENKTVRTCKYCYQQFVGFSIYKEHVLSHKGRDRFVCPYCPKKFISSVSRSAHVNTHTGERPHKCPHCPKGFAHYTNLEMHVRTHLKIYKFSCSYCGKRFIQSNCHKIHERMHTGEMPCQCEECGKRFICQKRLTLHIRTHANIRNHICGVCGKGFSSAVRLKEHMPSHSDERPFQCNICDQKFARRKSLRTHAELHSDVKKYVCIICGKAFAQYAGLYSHKKSHGEKPPCSNIQQ